MVLSESNAHDSIFFGEDRLVDVPSRRQMDKKVGHCRERVRQEDARCCRVRLSMYGVSHHACTHVWSECVVLPLAPATLSPFPAASTPRSLGLSSTTAMDPSLPMSSSPTREASRADAGRGPSSKGSQGSQSSQESPSQSPSQYAPMTNSLISNLDLAEDRHSGSSMGMGGNTASRQISGNEGSFANADDEGNGLASANTGDVSNGRAVPLAPRDVLNQPSSSPSTHFPTSSSFPSVPSYHGREGTSSSATGGDDSALDALVEAHQKHGYQSYPTNESSVQSESDQQVPLDSEHAPSTRDASFGLDPDADTSHSVQGSTPFRLSTSNDDGHQHHHHHHDSHVHGEGAHSHTTAATGAPATMKTSAHHTQTVPTASSTGMPRFLPRRTSHSGSVAESEKSSNSSQAPAPKEMQLKYSPSGSLTVAIFGKDLTWRRRGFLLLASFAINLGLPFINGVMLGFGEIFARTIVAPWIGLAPGAININAPGPRAPSTGGAGLRKAGVGVDGGRESVSVESWEVEPGQRGRSRGA